MVAKYEFDPDDARLSAYALGELPENERAAVEELLARDADARAFVDGLRETIASLEAGFRSDAKLELTGEQREAIVAKASKDESRKQARRSMKYAVAAMAALVPITTAAVLLAIAKRTRMEATQERVATGNANSRGAKQGEQLKSLGYSGGLEGLGYSSTPSGSERTKSKARLANPPSSPAPAAGATKPVFQSISEVRRLDGKPVSDPAPPAPSDNPPEIQDFLDEHAGVEHNTEAYDGIVENPFRLSRDEPLSTFSIDVDTASYANVRRFLRNGQPPPAGAVRLEELINYFDYDYPQPSGGVPFSVTADVASCPWNARHQLVRVGLKGRDVLRNERNASNLVFLIDVSGSMSSEDKLPLVIGSLKMLTEELDARDRIAIVVYAGASGLVLDSTSARNRGPVLDALEQLGAGGSTNGGEGIRLAYKVAREHFLAGGTNRVILCTDGDFNVGTTSEDELVALIEEQRKSGVFLSVLGFGTGNLKDSTMEKLADKGNGNYAYIDGLREARKVLVEQIGGTLETIAKDVKIQVEFNPAEVQAWRLVGYENRLLAHQDFDDDTKDAGEIGAGHTVTALYELVPNGVPFTAPQTAELRYQETPQRSASAFSDELAFVKLRYKQPDGDESKLLSQPIRTAQLEWQRAPADFRFAAAVAAFGMKLRASPHTAQLDWSVIQSLAHEALGRDERGYRLEFLDLVQRAAAIRAASRSLNELGYGDEKR